MRTGTKTNKRTKVGEEKLAKADFSLPLLATPVWETLQDIGKDMPTWFWDYECAVAIRALTNEEHHPLFWCLAAFMFEFERQSRPGAKRSMNFYGTPTYKLGMYPMTLGDHYAFGDWKLMWEGKGASLELNGLAVLPMKGRAQIGEAYDLSPVWERACLQVRSDIQRLMNAAVIAGDNTFFQKWGEACRAVARYAFGAKKIKGRREWCAGRWVGDIKWHEPSESRKPQAHSALVIEICTARLSFKVDQGRIPTDTETAEVIIQMRRQQRKISKTYLDDPKGYKKRLAAEVRTYCKRLGFTRVVVEKRRVKSGKTNDD